jgi:DNA-binding MarR family transcriptional regulator
MTQTPTLTGQDIAEAEGAVQALLDAILSASGSTTRNEYVVLRVLTVRGPAGSPAAFSEFLAGQRQLGLNRPAAAALLAGLEAKGLVSGSPEDGQGPVQLTAEGAALFAMLAEAIAPVTARLYNGIDPGDLAVAHEVLAQVTERAGHLTQEMCEQAQEVDR